MDNVPAKFDELLESVFSAEQSDPGAPPGELVTSGVVSYLRHASMFSSRLNDEIRQALTEIKDEHRLAKLASDLLQMEASKKQQFAPYINTETSVTAASIRNATMSSCWASLAFRLREGMLSELEALRDGRLRVEFSRAEIINRSKAGLSVRVILRSGTQIRVHFEKVARDESPQS
jgi:hypothetical protein